MYYNQNFNKCCKNDYNHERDCIYDDNKHEKKDKRRGCCMKYVQEICCYPSYYSESEFDNTEDNYPKQSNWNNCCNKKHEDNNECFNHKTCCFCNKFFHW